MICTSKFEPNSYPLNTGLRLIEASAGTGKTFAIAHLVLRLITEGKASINEILVVTFTEAAASELKSRISNRLEAALEGLDALSRGLETKSCDAVLENWIELNSQDDNNRHQVISRLLEALESIDYTDITTIHGFCKRTLQREAIDCGAPIKPILEEENLDLILEVVHNYWQREILTLPATHLKGLKAAGIDIKKISQTLIKLDNDPSLSFNIESLKVEPFEPLAKQFDEWVKNLWEIFLSYWRQEGYDLEEGLKVQAKEWRSEGNKDTKPFSPKPLKNRYEEITNWIEDVLVGAEAQDASSKISYGVIRQQRLFANYFHPGVTVETAIRCGEENPSLIRPNLQTAIAELWDGPAEQVLRHALSWSLVELEKRRKSQGIISYGGLLKAVDPKPITQNKKESLSQKEVLLKKLRLRYQVILIDEFQDTDSIQWRFLKQAFAISKKHLMILVGDPKQAIYRFRGGDLNIYKQARSEVERIDVLLDNYRTKAPLMKGINSLLAVGLIRSNLKVPPLISCVQNQLETNLANIISPIQLLTVEENSEDTSESQKTSTSKTTLEKVIPTAITNSVLTLLEGHKNDLDLSDICILVGRHEQANKIRESLACAGLPSRLVSQGDVLKSNAAEVLQRFLDCLAKPGNSSNLRLVACSSLIQWSVEELKESEKNGQLDNLALRFSFWSNNFSNLGILGCLSELLDGHKMADLSERGRMLSDLYQCSQLVQEAIHSQGLDATRAAMWLRKERLNQNETITSKREPNSDIAESAINVVTIHRSKGLEYRVVICPYLWQAPPVPVGPLWRLGTSDNWLISLNSNWGAGKEAAEENKQAAFEEAERLAYVAITRACDHLIILWAKGAKQKGNPLTSLLFGPSLLDADLDELTNSKMNQWITSNKLKVNLTTAQTEQINSQWSPPPLKGELSLGAIPQRKLDFSWRRNSYSSWVHNQNNSFHNSDLIGLEEGKDLDQRFRESLEPTIPEIIHSKSSMIWSNQSPLGNFPRGASAGDCLHRILERVEFCEPLHQPEATMIIEEELSRTGLGIELLKNVQDGLTQVLGTPIGGPLGKQKLKDISSERRLHELSFDLPLAQKGNQITSLDLVKVFMQDPDARFGSDYVPKLAKLNIYSRGFLTGSIDLVFTDQENLANARWWVADWKSNWIGKLNEEGEVLACGPSEYTEKAMEEQMLLHHYPLQAHLYLVALHRFLKWRLPNYDSKKHLGGYIYLFLRGVPGAQALESIPDIKQIPGLIVEKASLARVIELDRLLQEGGK